MLLVLRIGHRFQEVMKAPDASHVLRWASTLAFETEWIATSFLGLQTSFEQYFMIPAIAKIVLVTEPEATSV